MQDFMTYKNQTVTVLDHGEYGMVTIGLSDGSIIYVAEEELS